ncbi:MAG: outer membrane protein transport protein [Deltaproteobacteria bacterium]|nr:outer membrane protein transport protein [Deltaproteobacteria bacterium]
MRTLLLLAVLAGPTAATANPIDSFGLGSRGASMSGAMAAVATDFAANYYNPAGLARGRDLTLSFGYVWADPDLTMNGEDAGVDSAHGIVFGAAAPGVAAGIPFAFGIGLYLPDDRVSRVRSLPQRTPRWELYDNRIQRLYLAANVAIEPVPGFSMGGGLAFMSATNGTLDVQGVVTYPDPAQSDLRHRVDADLSSVRYPQVGLRWAPTKWLEVGLVYRGEFQLDLHLDAVLSGDLVAFDAYTIENARVALESTSVNAFLPQQVVLGVALRPGPFLIAIDLTWIDWSAYRSPTSKVDYSMDIPIPPDLQGSVTIPQAPPGVRPLDPDFRDRVVPRLGAEWSRDLSSSFRLAARAGWAFEATPVPDQPGETNFVDSDRHVLTAGIGLELGILRAILPKPVRVDVHGQLFVFDEREIEKESPADAVGDYRADGTITAAGATLGAQF